MKKLQNFRPDAERMLACLFGRNVRLSSTGCCF